MTLSVAVAGASGYAGGEIVRLLSSHPEFVLRTVTAHANAGQRLGEIHANLGRYRDLVLSETTAERLSGHDVVFTALPHGASGALTSQLSADTLVVDCGADHRLEDEAAWQAFYGGDYFGSWAYGIPELPRGGGKQRARLQGVKRIAAPGCNVSAVSIGLAPALSAHLVSPHDIVAVLAVGTSGAGRTLRPNLLASEVMGGASAYKVGGTHRHTPEMEQDLGWAAGESSTISFTPVLVPMSRGILSTASAILAEGVTDAAVRDAYRAAYAEEPFIRVLEGDSLPSTANVLGSNMAEIAFRIDRHAGRLVVISAIDNLLKGTAGAAIQCANIACGLPETLGLPIEGVAP